MKSNLAKRLLALFPLLALLAGCASTDNQGGTGTDQTTTTTIGEGNSPRPGNALEPHDSGVGITRQP